MNTFSEPLQKVLIANQGLASLRMSSWMMARKAMALVVSIGRSKSLEGPRLRPSQQLSKVKPSRMPALHL
jgi:hypothetical protein